MHLKFGPLDLDVPGPFMLMALFLIYVVALNWVERH